MSQLAPSLAAGRVAWRPSPVVHGLPLIVTAGLVLLATLLVFLVSTAGIGWALALLALAVPLVPLLWRWPMVGLVALVVLGPTHQFVMLLIFHFTRTPLVLKAAQLWKEAVVLLLLLKAIDLAFRRRTAPRFTLLDLGLLIFFAYGALYLLYPSQIADSSLMLSLMGLRADAFFLLAYFVGRGLPITRRQLRRLLTAFALTAVLIAVVAALQFAAPGMTNLAFESLSQREFTTLKQGEQAASFAVRVNDVKGFVIPRASSLVLSDLALAFYTLLAAPLAAALLLCLPTLRDKLAANVLLLGVLMTTVMTVTRSALIAMTPALGAIMLAARSPVPFLVVGIQAFAGVLPIIYTRDVTWSVLQDVFSPSEASAQGHFRAMEESIHVLQEQPFGRGLGTAGQVSQLYAPAEGITNESWYLQIATEMGIPAGILFALIVLGFGLAAFFQYGRVRDPWLKALCLGMGGATVGFGIVGATLHVWEAQTISIVFWLFAGLVMRAPDIEAAPAEG